MVKFNPHQAPSRSDPRWKTGLQKAPPRFNIVKEGGLKRLFGHYEISEGKRNSNNAYGIVITHAGPPQITFAQRLRAVWHDIAPVKMRAQFFANAIDPPIVKHDFKPDFYFAPAQCQLSSYWFRTVEYTSDETLIQSAFHYLGLPLDDILTWPDLEIGSQTYSAWKGILKCTEDMLTHPLKSVRKHMRLFYYLYQNNITLSDRYWQILKKYSPDQTDYQKLFERYKKASDLLNGLPLTIRSFENRLWVDDIRRAWLGCFGDRSHFCAPGEEFIWIAEQLADPYSYVNSNANMLEEFILALHHAGSSDSGTNRFVRQLYQTFVKQPYPNNPVLPTNFGDQMCDYIALQIYRQQPFYYRLIHFNEQRFIERNKPVIERLYRDELPHGAQIPSDIRHSTGFSPENLQPGEKKDLEWVVPLYNRILTRFYQDFPHFKKNRPFLLAN